MSIDEIMLAASNATGIPVNEIMSKSRQAEKAQARHLFCKVSIESGYSLNAVGRYIGRDHSTVYSSVNVANNQIEIYPFYRKQYETIMKELQN